jgi:hypothetical protein
MSQLVQVGGAIAILVAFAAAQLRLLTVESRLPVTEPASG